MYATRRLSLFISIIIYKSFNNMEFFNTMESVAFVVGEEHTTTAKMGAKKTNNGEKSLIQVGK